MSTLPEFYIRSFMAQAVEEGRKTQIRRPVFERPADASSIPVLCRDGKLCFKDSLLPSVEDAPCKVGDRVFLAASACGVIRRFEVEVTNVRFERIQDISESDAIAEGIEETSERLWKNYLPHGDQVEWQSWESPKDSFRSFYETLKKHTPWLLNPWVWVVEFRWVASFQFPPFNQQSFDA